MVAKTRIGRKLLFALLLATPLINFATPVKSMVIFGDSLSDIGNTTHLLKSLRREADPGFLVAPFKTYVINKMNDFANEYYVPQVVLDAGISLVNDFFDHEVAFYMTDLISKVNLVPIIPEKPYWDYRFSNGRVWSEYLAEMLSIPQHDEKTYVNRAFGGSWTATYDYQLTVWNLIRHPIVSIKNLIVGKLIPPSLGLTTQAYLLEHPQLNNESVYILFSGANDYLNVLQFEANYEEAAMSKYIDNVIDSLAAILFKLEHAGAKQFVIMGLPFLGETPHYINTTDREVLNAAVEKHNERLQQRIAQWQNLYPKADFLYVDMQSYLTKAVGNPEQYGFTNTRDACIDVVFPMFSAFANSPFKNNYVLQYAQVLQYQDKRLAPGQKNFNVCSNPDSYLFWDEIHPSTRAHKFLAYELCTAMQDHGYEVTCTDPNSIN